MGRLVDGVWKDEWYDTESNGGKFEREDAGFRDWIKADGSTEFLPESGRYHLYVSLACPWAHRTLIFRILKGLEDHIGVSVTHPHMLKNGWEYKDNPEPLYGYNFHHQLYTHVKPDYSGRVTVPVLWDKKTERIVNNESAEIIRMFNSEFNGVTGNTQDYYPEALRAEIDEINKLVYRDVNNGVYKCGFATTQSAYESGFRSLFSALDRLEEKLSTREFLCGDSVTEADWRLFTTLIRFDSVYYLHFKCNSKRIADYPNLSRLTTTLRSVPGIVGTINFEHIKQHYYYSHETINPHRIVPLGPL